MLHAKDLAAKQIKYFESNQKFDEVLSLISNLLEEHIQRSSGRFLSIQLNLSCYPINTTVLFDKLRGLGYGVGRITKYSAFVESKFAAEKITNDYIDFYLTW